MTRKQAIRAKCIDCMTGSRHEVKLCPSTDCALWNFRLGREIRTEDTQNGEESESANCS